MIPRMQARPFYEQSGLNSETYDVRTERIASGGVLDGDVDFYLGLAKTTPGPVLEMGCGTGRVAWALAHAGHAVLGVDRSAPMLAVAQAKRSGASSQACALARFEQGNMTDLRRDGQFGLVMAPFRAFQSLLTPEDQRRCLQGVRGLLAPEGRLALNLFDPRVELLGPDESGNIGMRSTVEHPVTHNVVTAEAIERRSDPLRQVFGEIWRFRELDASHVLREELEELQMRWTLRQELRWLLELCGFAVESDHGDYRGGPPRYGGEIVVVARTA
jgi:SAM-dependent methyltransferase